MHFHTLQMLTFNKHNSIVNYFWKTLFAMDSETNSVNFKVFLSKATILQIYFKIMRSSELPLLPSIKEASYGQLRNKFKWRISNVVFISSKNSDCDFETLVTQTFK